MLVGISQCRSLWCLKHSPLLQSSLAGRQPSRDLPQRLRISIETFVQKKSEGGRRAQAVVAGLLDVFAGTERVISGRVNDPSRRYPGDVLVCAPGEPPVREKAFEVRDKPVTETDVRIFARRCMEKEVSEVAVVMVSLAQKPLDTASLRAWASEYGIGLSLFHGWPELVDQILIWASIPQFEGAVAAAAFIGTRLREIEVAPESLVEWYSLLKVEP